MNDLRRYLRFTLDERQLAIALDSTERVIRAVEVTALPEAPEIVLGIIDLHGEVVPVLDTRFRLRLPRRALGVTDHFLLVRSSGRCVALVIDHALGIMELPAGAVTTASTIVPGLEHVSGIARLEDGLVLIQDLEKFLSLEEAAALESALEQEVTHGS
jgi:purine-binding chemotaxis protein CheW